MKSTFYSSITFTCERMLVKTAESTGNTMKYEDAINIYKKVRNDSINYIQGKNTNILYDKDIHETIGAELVKVPPKFITKLWRAFHLESKDKLTHIYAPEGLIGMLEKMDVKDPQGIRSYLENNPNKFSYLDEDDTEIAFILFLPTIRIHNNKLSKKELRYIERDTITILFTFNLLPDDIEIEWYLQNRDVNQIEMHHFKLSDFNTNKKHEESSDLEIREKAIINLIYYLNTFSESLKNEAPEGVKYVDNKMTLNKVSAFKDAEKLFNTKGSEMRTHIRAGHFRVLNSDKYIKKKGQSIYIKPTIVNNKGNKLYLSNKLND